METVLETSQQATSREGDNLPPRLTSSEHLILHF